MKIAIIGYGRMGRAIETTCKEKNYSYVTIDSNVPADFKEINSESLAGVDVCIDFSHPDSVINNIKAISSQKKDLVMGTTGWYDSKEEVKKIIEGSNTGFIWSGNFSLGVNAFFKILEQTAKIMNNIEGYDVFGYELHHNQKADSPSGTAAMLTEILIKNLDNKDSIVNDKLERKIKPNELHFASIRGGATPGTHIVCFDSSVDTIELIHTARTREGFAKGAIIAAEWIQNKKGFYHIDDMMKDIIK